MQVLSMFLDRFLVPLSTSFLSIESCKCSLTRSCSDFHHIYLRHIHANTSTVLIYLSPSYRPCSSNLCTSMTAVASIYLIHLSHFSPVNLTMSVLLDRSQLHDLPFSSNTQPSSQCLSTLLLVYDLLSPLI